MQNRQPSKGLHLLGRPELAGFANTVSWQGRTDLSELAGKSIKLKFYTKNVKLFAYQFVV